jgi:NO-binding membrane sensor protein with MHYT domain
MTTRQFLLRRANATIRGTVAFLLVAGALLTYSSPGFVMSFVIAVVIAAVALAAFWSLFEVPCPNCRKSLGSIGFRVANGQMRHISPKCPHCGVSLDETLPGRN